MAVSLKHTTQAVGTDAGNGEIRKAQWNEEHTLTAAADTLLGATTAGPVTEITCTAAGRALLDDADASEQRATLAAAGTGVTNTFTANQIISVTDNTNAALRITQLGTGNAILVEDSTNPDATPFVVTADGSVGVGIATPTEKLYVVGPSGGISALFTDSVNSTLYIRHESPGNLLTYESGGAAQQRWVTNSAERMRIDSSGNVTVGGESVNALRYLDVSNVNTGASAGSIFRLITSNVAGTGLTSVDLVKYKTGAFVINNNETNSAAATVFSVAGSERMRITSAGNVGIGTASPQVKLDVNGDINVADGQALRWGGGSSVRIAAANVSNVLGFYTSNTERARFSGADFLITSTGGLGYGGGSGGTVTQATSKFTTVTLNKTNGQITMNNAAVAAGVDVSFQVNNTTVAATDVVIVNCASGVTNGNNYRIDVVRVVAGAFAVRVVNVSGGSLSEAIQINFAIIKATTS